jgi:putative acetyltransferase
MATIEQAETVAEIDMARRLFREYQETLQLDLCFQGFEAELNDLPGKYAPPDGRLLIACVDAKAAGCVALRPLSDGIAEMKRLYVRSEFRGQKIGRQLLSALITEARSIGYASIRLDTSPEKMRKAVKLYESHGFREIPPYYDNPNADVRYMELLL